MNPTAMSRAFLFGASGHAKVVLDIVAKAGRYETVFLADDDPKLAGAHVRGVPVVVGRKSILSAASEAGVDHAIVSIGSNHARLAVAAWLIANRIRLLSAVHPSAVVDPSARIGQGSAIMAGVVINADVVIGDNVIVNTGATIDHDCTIGDGAHIAPGAHLCGNVSVGAGSLLGAGSIVIPGISIGADALVGAGSTVLRDVPASMRVAGSPATAIIARRRA